MFILIPRPQKISKQNFIMTGADIEFNEDPPAWHFQYELTLQTLSFYLAQIYHENKIIYQNN